MVATTGGNPKQFAGSRADRFVAEPRPDEQPDSHPIGGSIQLVISESVSRTSDGDSFRVPGDLLFETIGDGLVDLFTLDQLSTRVNIQPAGGALQLRATLVRPEITPGALTLHITYEFVKG